MLTASNPPKECPAQTKGLSVRRSPDGEEQTKIVFSPLQNELSIDFASASLDNQIRYRKWVISPPHDPLEKEATVTTQSAPLALSVGEPLHLRVFLDHSILEVFANGKQCITQRIFPTRDDSLGVSLHTSDGEAYLLSLDAWEIAN